MIFQDYTSKADSLMKEGRAAEATEKLKLAMQDNPKKYAYDVANIYLLGLMLDEALAVFKTYYDVTGKKLKSEYDEDYIRHEIQKRDEIISNGSISEQVSKFLGNKKYDSVFLDKEKIVFSKDGVETVHRFKDLKVNNIYFAYSNKKYGPGVDYFLHVVDKNGNESAYSLMSVNFRITSALIKYCGSRVSPTDEIKRVKTMAIPDYKMRQMGTYFMNVIFTLIVLWAIFWTESGAHLKNKMLNAWPQLCTILYDDSYCNNRHFLPN